MKDLLTSIYNNSANKQKKKKITKFSRVSVWCRCDNQSVANSKRLSRIISNMYRGSGYLCMGQQMINRPKCLFTSAVNHSWTRRGTQRWKVISFNQFTQIFFFCFFNCWLGNFLGDHIYIDMIFLNFYILRFVSRLHLYSWKPPYPWIGYKVW